MKIKLEEQQSREQNATMSAGLSLRLLPLHGLVKVESCPLLIKSSFLPFNSASGGAVGETVGVIHRVKVATGN